MVEYLKGQLNPNAYQVRMMEFGADLADSYGDLYEIEINKDKKNLEEINRVAAKCIENANLFTSIVYTKDDKEDKFEYVIPMLNNELSVASKLSKWISADARERIDKTKEALDIYKKLDQYIKEYMEFKGITKIEEIENEAMQ